MELVTSVFVASVFGAGVLSFFSPCVLPLLPVYIGYLSGDSASEGQETKASLSKALAFMGGLSAAFVLLGFGAGAAGQLFNNPLFFLICGVIVVLFGVIQTGLVSLPFLNSDRRVSLRFDPRKGLWGAFLLGFFFSFGWTPCVGPVLGAVLGISSQQGSALTGAWLLLVYSLGLSLPFCALALGSQQLLKRVKGLYPHMGKIRLAGGILIILMGLWMLYNQALVMRAESRVSTVAAPVSVNSSAYNLALSGLDREALSLAQLQGKTVYIKFWATWCPSCLAGLEDFTALANEAASSSDIVVISIVTPGIHGEMSRKDFSEWAKSQQLSFPVYFDEAGAVNREFGIWAYPTALYLNKQGEIAKKTLGYEDNASITSFLNSLNDK